MTEESKDYPECVFLEEVKCKVRMEIQASSKIKKLMEPLKKKFDDRAVAVQIGKDMMEGIIQALGHEWNSLAMFCHVCPILTKLKFSTLPIPSTPSRVQPSEELVPSPQVEPVKEEKPLMIVGHDLVIERKSETKPVVDLVQKFSRLNRASKDVLIFNINRLSLWKAAERLTSFEVLDFLRRHAKSKPSDSLKRWISRTMSEWGSLKIVSEDNYEVLEAVDEKVLDRVLAIREVKNHIFRKVGPTRARIIKGKGQHRGALKQILIEKGYPVKDLGRYEEFEPLRFELKPEVMKDRRYQEYQREAVESFLKYGAGTIVLPGGSGKTVIAVVVAAKLKAPTLVLATRSEICEQFKREFLEKTTISPYHVSVIHGQTPASKRVIKPITITTYQMATGALSSRLWNRKWGLVVHDESQHVPARIWSRTSRIQTIRRLGLTATPIREDKQEKLIFSLIGPPVFERGWLEMAEEGFIARAKAYEILVDMSQKYARRYTHSTNERERYILASTNPGKYAVIGQLLEKYKDDKLLILGYYVQGALEIGKKFDVPVIHGEVSHRERHRLYDQFRKGEIKRLVLTSVGEEGVDLPSAKVLIEVCGLYGSRMAMGQRFGRILRPKEGVSVFYELVSRGTSEQDFSEKRRQFLIGKGYEFEEVQA